MNLSTSKWRDRVKRCKRIRTALAEWLVPSREWPFDHSCLISFVFQSRNDGYMGNSNFRLACAINQITEAVSKTALQKMRVEILVVDWGSQHGLRKVLVLTPAAQQLVRFVEVSDRLASLHQLDSPYSVPHAVNVGVRRSSGRFIMTLDSDAFLPIATTQAILAGLLGRRSLGGELNTTTFWAPRYHIPSDFHSQEPSLENIEHFALSEKHRLNYDRLNMAKFGGCAVAMLATRKIWETCRGLDERMIYWGAFDIDLFNRLRLHYCPIDLETQGLDFFHLEHYFSRQTLNRKLENNRKSNRQRKVTGVYNNGKNWGLGHVELPIHAA